MKALLTDFAAFGGRPTFAAPLRVAPPARPSWEKTEAQLRGIFERRYFANHGPLVSKLDARFAHHVGRKHAISVVNGGLALMILSKGLDLQGGLRVLLQADIADCNSVPNDTMDAERYSPGPAPPRPTVLKNSPLGPNR